MIPISLLTDIRQTWLCSLMIRARKKSLYTQPGDEQSAVLYDYCMEHGLTKLSPEFWTAHLEIGSQHHKWIVWDICMTSYVSPRQYEPLSDVAISAVSAWLTGGQWVCPRITPIHIPLYYLDRGILGPGDGRTQYDLSCMVYNQSKSDPRFRLYQAANKLGLLPPCPPLTVNENL